MEVFFVPKVKHFIRDLPDPLIGRAQRMFDLLEAHGNTLRMPYSRSLGNGLFELRVVGSVHVRFVYFFHIRKAIVVHALTKKRPDLSPRDVAYARIVQKEVLASI